MSAEAPRNSGAGEPIPPQRPVVDFQGELFDLTSSISTFVGIQTKQQEDQKGQKERREEAARAKFAAEATAFQSWKEKAKEIVITSGVRDLIEQTRTGLTNLYPNATKVERGYLRKWAERESYDQMFDYYSDGVFNGRNGGKAIGGFSDYLIRLAWEGGFQYGRQVLRPEYVSEEFPHGEYNYIDVLSDGKEGRLVIRSKSPVSSHYEDRIFEGDEWKNAGELALAIFEAIKSPCYMHRDPPRPSRGSNWVEKMEYRLVNGEHG